jgi:hypothetical protein
LNRKIFRKSLNVNSPEALLTSDPKLLLTFVDSRLSKLGAANCWVVTLSDGVINARRTSKERHAEL